MTHAHKKYAGLLLVLAFAPAHSQIMQCEVANAGDVVDRSLFGNLDDDSTQVIQFEAGNIEAQLGDRPSAEMTDGVRVRQGDRLARADSAIYDPDRMALQLKGGVRYEDPNSQITSDSAEFSYSSGHIRFEGAEFRLQEGGARGAASGLEINQEGRLELDDVSYTTCPPGSNDWLIQARDIDIDSEEGVGTARNVALRFQGIPILYSPYLSFPIGDARKSGILTPEFGSSGRSGRALSIPYYWNIAPNYDATLTPRLLSDRGLQLNSEFRYLTSSHDGTLKFDYLPNDDKENANRHLLGVKHRTLFSVAGRAVVDYREVSDSRYFEDLGSSLSISSITHLNRSIRYDFHGEHLSVLGRFQEFQTIDDAILPADEPYRRVPQVLINGYWPNQAFGLGYGFGGELVNFDREVGVTGWRLNAAPQIDLPFERPGWFITPSVVLQHTSYELDNVAPGQPANPSRTLPIASLDTGLILERELKSSPGRIQTLEPRILYVHVPYREQSELPVFDTIIPDLNLVALFRKNRFLGVDRIADTDQVSIGITSRILNVATGQELVTATIGQALYLSEQGVTLPSQSMSISDSSDYIARVQFLLFENWNFDLGHQWGTGGSGATQSQARIQYRPQTNKVLNLSYRFRRDSIEQGDVSLSWPVARSWNIVGRYNYSFRDSEPLEEFVGIEYESCCWGLRLVSRRHISTRDGTRDTSFGLQLVLKGMTSLGTKADRLLEHGILGYSSDRY